MSDVPGVPASSSITHVLAGGGEMGALMRGIDWSQTAIGPVDRWPQSLRTVLSILLNSRHPIFVWWGPELVQFYNDAYRPILGATKHPLALGQRGRECWREIWDVIGPMIAAVMERGEATFLEDSLLVLDRNGYLEECYFIYAYSPIHNELGGVGGVFVTCNETTTKVLGGRRLRTLRDIADRTVGAKSAASACAMALEVLAANRADLPFAALYILDNTGSTAQLIDTIGLAPGGPASLAQITLERADPAAPEAPIVAVARGGAAALITDLIERFGALPGGPWPEAPHTALALPVPGANEGRPVGVLMVGISPRLPFDDDYRGFLDLIARHIGSAVANARAYEYERQRAEALAEIDRAKTTFFSNVSHEFRTPLTLMLGPIEDSLADAREPLTPRQHERQELIYRNGLRLLKLVNTLLDFARIEAGRVQATYAPLDLSMLTAQLAGVFRSAVERAGLRLLVACAPLHEPVYVDRELWEKIVFNLLSNALKYTFAGEIAVTLAAGPGAVELRVRDTGTGIPAEELPHLFERFYRVAGARGRTYEGTGIGLALVQELVRLHGGAVHVESRLGAGTTFSVTIPTGVAHLPRDQVVQAPVERPVSVAAMPFLEEASRWNVEPSHAVPFTFGDLPAPTAHEAQAAEQILIADDNADMRDYLVGLLDQSYIVTTVSNGLQALAAVQRRLPDLLITDVMMPRLDGLGLLRALRADQRSADLPVIMLSARAGDEATIEGLQAGANDYLVKPFSARELRARVAATLELARLRREASTRDIAERERLRWLFEQLPAIICVLREPGHLFDLVNAAFQRLFPDRALLGRSIGDALPELSGQSFQEALDEVTRSGVPYMRAGAALARQNAATGVADVRYYDYVIQPLGDGVGAVRELLIFAVDVTERERTQKALLHSQKLESLGVLAGGIAHDFNNLLAAILGNAELALMDLDLGHDARVSVEQIQLASRRAADLTSQMLAYSGRGQFMVAPLDANALIRDMLPLLRVSIAKSAALHAALGQGPLLIGADAAQLRQLIMNLVINAAEALDGAGAVTVSVAQRWIDRAYLAACYMAPDLHEGSFLALEVSDTGSGMSPAILARIFDPFFTTKFMGRGLGLAAVLGIVRAHHGALHIESAPGQGTTMTVLLPLGLALERPALHDGSASQAPAAAANSATILVIDDELEMRQVATRILERLGYRVLTANDGRAGLELARQHSDEIACFLLDLTMPGLSGEETFRQLRADWPARPVILMSGYGEQDMGSHFTNPADLLFVQKPFAAVELRRVLEQAQLPLALGPSGAANPDLE